MLTASEDESGPLFITRLRELSSKATRAAILKECVSAECFQIVCHDVLTTLEATLMPLIKRHLERRAAKGFSDAYMNFDRENFRCAQIGSPRDVANLFFDELSNLSGAICVRHVGLLHGIQCDVWNNAKFTVHFKWR